MTDTVTLSFPRDARYYSVARLVVGGMAAPLEMSFDALDDLQLAISSLLDHEDLEVTGDLTLRLDVDADNLRASIGRFAPSSVATALDRQPTESSGPLGLRRLLDTIVDGVEISESGDGEWVTLIKRVKASV